MAAERILVVCAASDTLLGRLIRKLTRSSVNHTFLLYESRLWGGWWAAQIGPTGVAKLPADKVRKLYSVVECYEYDADLSWGLRACREMVGDPYDYLAILGSLVVLAVWNLTGKRIRNPWHRRNHEFCSEFVASALKADSVEGFVACDPASMWPGDVREAVLANPHFTWREWPA